MGFRAVEAVAHSEATGEEAQVEAWGTMLRSWSRGVIEREERVWAEGCSCCCFGRGMTKADVRERRIVVVRMLYILINLAREI